MQFTVWAGTSRSAKAKDHGQPSTDWATHLSQEPGHSIIFHKFPGPEKVPKDLKIACVS